MQTTERLAQAIIEAGIDDPDFIADARAGKYDDFKSPSATPIMDLVREFRRRGLSDLARRAMSGEFDASPEEADAWMNSSEGRQALRESGWLL